MQWKQENHRWLSPISPIDGLAERLSTWKKDDADMSFSSLRSIEMTCRPFFKAAQRFGKNKRTHTRCIGKLCPFCQTFSLLFIIAVFFSTVHPPILFPRAGTGPACALNTRGITSGDPTQLITSGGVIAGKSERQDGERGDKNRRGSFWGNGAADR